MEPFLETHMASLVVEFAARGKNSSPVYKLWGDGNWAEFYQYDLYRALGMTAEAQSFHDSWIDPGHYDNFPAVRRTGFGLVLSSVERSR